MNRTIITLFMTLCCISGFGQNYGRVSRDNFWNEGRNAAGIRQDSTSIAFAELFGGYTTGGLHDYGDASKTWNAGARTKAFKHMDRLSLAGGFSFEQRQGYDMFGSMFIEPGFYPIDILEFTPGRKTLQTYTFDGSMSYDLSSSWRIGAGMDFLSSNISKSKDLRHTNYRLDFQIEPSVMWHSGDLAIGLAGTIGKNSESVDAEVIGTAESTYHAFFDKGLMYGLYEGWEGSGIHLDEAGVKGFPVREILAGGSMQFSWKDFYADFEYLYRDGKIGEKDFLWYKFPGHQMCSHLGYRFTPGDYSHSFRVKLSMLRQQNHEAILDKVSEGGVTTVTIYSFNRIFERRTYDIEPEYELVSDLWELKWKGKAGFFNGVSSQKYPFVYMQNIIDLSTSVDALVHVWKFDIGAGAGFDKGIFEEMDKLMQPASDSNRPDSIEDYRAYRIEYMTAPKIKAGLSLKFNFWKGLYVQAEGGYEHALNVTLMPGNNRIRASLRMGYDF